MKTTALAILALIASMNACASSPAPCQGRNCTPPTAGEKVAKELARAEDRLIRQVIWGASSGVGRRVGDVMRGR
jgi:hypothetical protein